MSLPLRAVIADDQALVRTGFRMILTTDGIDVVAEAADGAEAIAAVRRTRPDVVLMDIRMPQMDGIEATRQIVTGGADETRVLILTTYDLDHYVYAALTAGASGFLLKDVSPEHLVAAVRLVRSGDALLAPTITRRLVERFARRDDARGALHRDLSELTPRELVARNLCEAVMRTVQPAPGDGLAQRRLGEEVPVDAPVADAQGPGHVQHCGLRRPVAAQDVLGGRQVSASSAALWGISARRPARIGPRGPRRPQRLAPPARWRPARHRSGSVRPPGARRPAADILRSWLGSTLVASAGDGLMAASPL
ncbi:DNA-binding NarL/FixJ family response regulator [Streptosporangium album]|uniref:DNA-binding NarL/FixJ family response regulator n=1 Tax=Streptosporangium album TaxID=47479 RepID=A0A7W7WEB2_9ACTN|nr:response regulator [Streptosporangium album]MBB4943275.1 DNA-binding NarL/FixJ family response regulator [Streptosporangium album]